MAQDFLLGSGCANNSRMLGVVENRRRQPKPSLCPDQRPDSLFLIEADFKDQVTAWFQEPHGFLDQLANHVQPARAAIKGCSRLVIAYSRLEMRDGPARYVRGIGDDRVERAFPRERLEPFAQSKIDPVRDANLGGISPGDCECILGNIDGNKASSGLAVRRSDRQTTRSRPHIDGTGRCEVAGLLQVFDHYKFRFRTGNQHGRRDCESERIKLFAPDEIGDRRALGAPANQLAKCGPRRLADFLFKMRVKLHSLAIEDMGQHDLRVEARTLRPVALEVIGGPRQQSPNGPRILGPCRRAGG
jgi:hypothetical protein